MKGADYWEVCRDYKNIDRWNSNLLAKNHQAPAKIITIFTFVI